MVSLFSCKLCRHNACSCVSAKYAVEWIYDTWVDCCGHYFWDDGLAYACPEPGCNFWTAVGEHKHHLDATNLNDISALQLLSLAFSDKSLVDFGAVTAVDYKVPTTAVILDDGMFS